MDQPPPIKRLQRKLTIDVLWIYIVSVLLSEGPTYGYDVRRRISEKYGFKPATVTTYTVLYRLERERVLEKDESGVYKVTQYGEKLYEKALEILRGTLEKLEEVSRRKRS
ncbi:MAG: PadR family transcriptional regulator [Desulfurococcales archaeon]|nr:PadR family transcriptional regulator [Desulfurococcales archaeon]